MSTREPPDDRTLQDDRAELAADPHEGSLLTEGEGAPLAQDDVPTAESPPMIHSLLGGAPVAIEAEPRSGGGMTAPDDRPIGD